MKPANTNYTSSNCPRSAKDKDLITNRPTHLKKIIGGFFAKPRGVTEDWSERKTGLPYGGSCLEREGRHI